MTALYVGPKQAGPEFVLQVVKVFTDRLSVIHRRWDTAISRNYRKTREMLLVRSSSAQSWPSAHRGDITAGHTLSNQFFTLWRRESVEIEKTNNAGILSQHKHSYGPHFQRRSKRSHGHAFCPVQVSKLSSPQILLDNISRRCHPTDTNNQTIDS